MIDKYINRIKEIESDFSRKILEDIQKLDENEDEEVFGYLVLSLASKLMLILAKYDIESGDKKYIFNKLDRLIVGLKLLISSDIEGLIEMSKENKSSFYSNEEDKTVH